MLQHKTMYFRFIKISLLFCFLEFPFKGIRGANNSTACITNSGVTSEVTGVDSEKCFIYIAAVNNRKQKMIDTIRLNLLDCQISDSTPLTIQPCSYTHSDQKDIASYDLFVDTAGEVVTGQKAFYNSKYFNLTILPKLNVWLPERDTNKINLLVPQRDKKGKLKSIQRIRPGHFDSEKFNSKIFLQFSFPRFKKETNFKELKQKELFDVLDFVSKELRDIGIKTNIYNSDLSRIDSFTNITTSEPFQAYTPVFTLLEATRKKAVEWNGQTYLWRSDEHQITCYDKIEEMRAKIKDENVLSRLTNNNVLRIENRWNTKRKIFSKLKFQNVYELLDNYDTLKTEFKNDIESTIFRYKENQIEWLTGKQINQALQTFCNSGRRYWFREFMVFTGYLSLTKLTTPEIILKAIDELNIQGSESKVRVIKHRIKKNFYEAKLGSNFADLNYLINRKSNKELYEELRTKFLKKVA